MPGPRTSATPGFFAPAFDAWTGDAGVARTAAPAPRPPRSPRRRAGLVTGVIAVLAAVTLVGPASANADPSGDSWYRLRMCESSNNYAIDTGNGYYGAYQFDLATWRSVGGSGYPNQASAAEQDTRALQLYRMRGWQPWTCARILGLSSDADAGSGRSVTLPAAPTPAAPAAPTGSAPAWPGTYWSYGDFSTGIAAFQRQMGTRGAPLVGTGQFGANTLATVKRLQAANGIPQTGLLGPVTWGLAWNGKY